MPIIDGVSVTRTLGLGSVRCTLLHRRPIMGIDLVSVTSGLGRS